MKQFKKMKKVWAFLLALVMVLSVIPADAAWAADKYAIKRGCAKEGVLFTESSANDLFVKIYKNGKDISKNKKEENKVKWNTSDPTVVQLEWEGGCSTSVKGKKEGTATITATYRGKSVSFKITVKGATLTIDEADSEGYVPAGLNMVLHVRGGGWDEFDESDDIHYSSSNSSVVKVLEDDDLLPQVCVIRGVKEGTAVITAESKLGTVKCTVTVLPKMELQVNKVKDIKKNGKIVGTKIKIVNRSAKPVTVLEGAVDVDEIGKVKGGSATIKAGQKKTVTVLLE